MSKHTLSQLVLVGGVVVGFGTACDLITGNGNQVEPALIRLGGQIAILEMPDTVARGVPFTVRVQTFGGGCTREAARTEAKPVPTGVEIRPYNRTSTGTHCLTVLLYLYHTSTLSLNTSGSATVAVVGAQRGVSSSPQTEPARLEHTIFVR